MIEIYDYDTYITVTFLDKWDLPEFIIYYYHGFVEYRDFRNSTKYYDYEGNRIG